MTVRLDFSHEFPFSADTYVELFFSRGLIDHLKEVLPNMDEYRLELLERTDERLLRTVKVAPQVELPRPVRLILGRKKRLAWLETTSHEIGTQVMTWNLLTSVVPEKVSIGGTYVLEDLGPNLCKRTVLGEVEVRARGVGGLIEDLIAKQMEKSFGSGREHMIAYEASRR